MRAHCINLYAADDVHVGDIWLSAPQPMHSEQRLILDLADTGQIVSLSPSNVRDLRDACDEFLTALAPSLPPNRFVPYEPSHPR